MLKDKTKREMYDKVLVEGLPNWRNPAFYFRRMRMINFVEGLLYLLAIATGIKYCMNEVLSKRLKELQNQMAKKDHEIDFLQTSIDEMTKEYEGLLEIKIALDLEIGAYRKMLEDEESRLNLSQSMEADITDSGRGTKRKRLMETEEYSGFNITTSHTQPGQWLIESLEENLQCIKVQDFRST